MVLVIFLAAFGRYVVSDCAVHRGCLICRHVFLFALCDSAVKYCPEKAALIVKSGRETQQVKCQDDQCKNLFLHKVSDQQPRE